MSHSLQAPGYPPHFSTTMKTTLSTIFSRNNVMNALLALCTAIEFCYDMGARFGTWYRNGGNAQLRNAFVMAVAALLWLGETARLGYAVVRRDGPQWLAQANATRHRISRAFSYEYAA
ncbi:hypothetical protein BOW86_gp108 [Synechococcus phage S-CAM7]|uniref:Uncharacterized protein n=1 Tax=Synechococcus phage S-CAM7 TaxID=1883368 RepID=A0A1D8KTQ2_9CAUD|nr:hypothetical protein BOW86_gp108 [Synechococcus phage S-CAM7]AOV62032.1 hypothetical protein C490910_108 [Synechococcus phage S-CAM7]